MNQAPGALAPLVRLLQGNGQERLSADLGDGLMLVVTSSVIDRDTAMRVAMARIGRALVISRSQAEGRYALVAAEAGRLGLDMETVGRVALNATPHDQWLAPAERMTVMASGDAATELACRWVLKEAYGKARGVGLDLPLDRMAFGASGDGIALQGDDGPPTDGNWRFGLYRDNDALFGIAFSR